MKYRISAFLLALLLLLSACAPAANAAVGSWLRTEKTVGGEAQDLSQMIVEYKFKNDGTFVMKVDGMEAANGTYTIENNIVIWSVGNNSGYLTMENDTLIAETTENGKAVITKYSRS